MPGYYDIDEILAEEVLIPCKTSFTFSFLGTLDPDNDTYDNNDDSMEQQQGHNNNNYDGSLPEGSIIQMPVWAIRKWADLNFIRLGIPKQYRLKAREKYESDPSSSIGCNNNSSYGRNERSSSSMTNDSTSIANLKYTQYFECGKVVCDLIDTCCKKVTTDIKSSTLLRTRSSGRIDRSTIKQLRDINELQIECNKVRLFLYTLYKGRGRLGITMDWSLSCYGDDDVSTYVSKLTMIEQRLFTVGAVAVTNHHLWKLYNNPRLLLSSSSSNTTTTNATTTQSTANDIKKSNVKTSNNNNNNNRFVSTTTTSTGSDRRVLHNKNNNSNSNQLDADRNAKRIRKQ